MYSKPDVIASRKLHICNYYKSEVGPRGGVCLYKNLPPPSASPRRTGRTERRCAGAHERLPENPRRSESFSLQSCIKV